MSALMRWPLWRSFDASARDLRMCGKRTLPLEKLFTRALFMR
jgi:hypothetical protein